LSVALCQAAAFTSPASAQWSRFRGPNGAGVSQTTTVPVTWGESDFTFRAALPGVGHGSPVIWGQRLFMASGEESSGVRILGCYSTKDGSELWSHRYESGTHSKHALNSFASTTAAANERVVVFCWGTPKQILMTAFTHQGRELWKRDLGPFKSGHGFGVSPIIEGKLAIIPIEHGGQSAVVAVELTSGEVRWKHVRDSKLHYATPCIRRSGKSDAEVIVTNWKQGVTALSAKTGAVVWDADVFDKQHVESSIGSPVIAGDLVLGVCGWLGYGNEVVAVKPPASSTGAAEVKYRIKRGAPLCTTPLVVDELLFLWSDNGIVTCANAKTGESYWRKRVKGNYYSSPIAVGGRIYNVNTEGRVFVLAASQQFEQLAENTIGESSHSSPAVANGTLYWRTFTHLIALGPAK
jgi:outer membrane protein assembly factor BamB